MDDGGGANPIDVRHAVRRLTPVDRKLFALRHVDHLTQQQGGERR
jgi:hypothetical protein